MVSTSAQASSSKPSLKGKERERSPVPSTAAPAVDSVVFERKKRKLQAKYPDASPQVIQDKANKWFERHEKRNAERSAVVLGELESGDEAAVPGLDWPAWSSLPVAESVENVQSPVWSQDGRFHFQASGRQILIYESSPPDYALVATLPPSSEPTLGHASPITSFKLHPTNPLELITASLDGTIKVWSWTDGRLVRTLNAALAVTNDDAETAKNVQITRMAVGIDNGKPFICLAADVASREYQILTHLVRIPMRVPLTVDASGRSTPGSLSQHLARLGQINQTVRSLQISPQGTYVSIISSDGSVYIRKLSLNNKHSSTSWVKVSTSVAVTCLEWYPSDSVGTLSLVKKGTEEWFATGDRGGVVRLYQSGLSQAFRSLQSIAGVTPISGSSNASLFKIGQQSSEIQLTSTPLHWHSHPVRALCFTLFGGQLLSGGEENVLVTWHLDTLKPSFMARLSVGATRYEWIGVKPMNSSTSSSTASGAREEEYWSGFVDGSIVKVGAATGKAYPVGKRARISPSDAQGQQCQLGKRYPLAFHEPTQSLVLQSSHPSTLQFFQPSTSNLLFDLEVSPSNRVTRADREAPCPVRVSSVVFSPATTHHEQGTWMATYETRDATYDQGPAGQVRTIKLWYWTKSSGYVLNTQLDQVHGPGQDVTSMSFAPDTITPHGSGLAGGSGWLLLTTGMDGNAKVWTVKRGTTEIKAPGKKRALEEAFWALRSCFSYRDSPITCGTFSPDGTLIVLCQDSLLTLWSTATNALLRPLECPDIKVAAQVMFMGLGGRYLIVRGEREYAAGGGLAVWDLLKCGGPIFSREGGKASWIMATGGKRDDEFVALDCGKQITRIENFKISPGDSVSLSARHSVPFGTVQAIVTPSAQNAVSEFTGLLRDGRVVRFGPQVLPFERSLFSSEQMSQTHKVATAAAVKNISIWEEMFGQETFIDVQHDHLDQPSQEMAHDTDKTEAIPEQRGRYSTVFDAPVASLPRATQLFDTFVRDFMALSTRNTKAMTATEADNAAATHHHHHTKVTVSSAPNVASGGGAGVRDVERSSDSRMVPEREVRGWFSGMVGPRVPRQQASSRPAAIPSTPLPSGGGSSFSTPASAHVNGSAGKRGSSSKRAVSGSGPKGTPSRASLHKSGEESIENVSVGSKRKQPPTL